MTAASATSVGWCCCESYETTASGYFDGSNHIRMLGAKYSERLIAVITVSAAGVAAKVTK
jgi:hypothetical protein